MRKWESWGWNTVSWLHTYLACHSKVLPDGVGPGAWHSELLPSSSNLTDGKANLIGTNLKTVQGRWLPSASCLPFVPATSWEVGHLPQGSKCLIIVLVMAEALNICLITCCFHCLHSLSPNLYITNSLKFNPHPLQSSHSATFCHITIFNFLASTAHSYCPP